MVEHHTKHCVFALLSPSFAYMSNPAPDSSLCRAAAPQLHRSTSNCCSPFLSTSAAARRLRPLQLLLAACIRFNCSSPILTAPRLHPLLLPDCIRFNCCSLIASASTAAPRLHRLRLLLPDCIDPLVASPVLKDSSPCPMFFVEFEVQQIEV